jgi:predicted phosphodiesterase
VKLWAVSDLHVGYPENREIVKELPAHPDDWLVLGGDLGESPDELVFVLETLRPRFRRLIWVPGNHELWAISSESALQGEAKYLELVALCRSYGALTPEDPYPIFDGGPEPHLIAPLFTLYDYSFAPQGMTPEQAKAWAAEHQIVCADEELLLPDPYPTREAWCAARCAWTEQRLDQALATHHGPTVLINHFPLVAELAVLPAIPRFRIWCGTRRTRDWHRRFRASVVVSGHLHIPGTRIHDGVRFEEVSLGYPRQWKRRRRQIERLRQILPAP